MMGSHNGQTGYLVRRWTRTRYIETVYTVLYINIRYTPHQHQHHWIIIILFLGIFFVLPCIETYQKVDLRTITLDVPPQEVKNI